MERKVTCENFPNEGAKQQPSGSKWQPKFKSIKVSPKKNQEFLLGLFTESEKWY